MINRLLLTLLAAVTVLGVHAQDWGRVVRGDCTPGLSDMADESRGAVKSVRFNLPKPNNNWDPNKIYKQLVVLVSYSDTDFKSEDPFSRYNKMLNEPGYNEGVGPGCMADYFREQSNGMFNLSFDVFGPYKVSTKAKPNENADDKTRYHGTDAMREATKKMVAEKSDWDFKQYDWNGDGIIEQVIYIFAGMCGNQGEPSYGHLWPNTDSFSVIRTPDGVEISNYSASAELWNGTLSCGIGTICHEFTHSLGLPDIYPTNNGTGYYSVCDEWDLMDGGNFTNRGWCPPNYTAVEKMLMGWLTPTELTSPLTISGMKPLTDGGEAYIVKHTKTEYYVMENRQQTGWDTGIPGRGLVIYHVDYQDSNWRNNTVNNTKDHFRFDLVHADNLDYEQWDVIQPRSNAQYVNKPMLNNRHLSTSAYPWSTDSTTFVNNELTDTSTPAAVMYNKNTAASKLLSKPITNIVVNGDGMVSFDFMGGDATAISTLRVQPSTSSSYFFNLQGQRVDNPSRGVYIKEGRKYLIH